MLIGARSRVTPPPSSQAVAAGVCLLLLALAAGCEGVGQEEAQAPQRSASFGVSHQEAAFLLGFCRDLVSSTSPETKPGHDDPFRAAAGGDIVFNITIDAPALTLPNMQLTAHNFDLDLSVSRLHVPMVNYAAYGGLLLVQLVTFVVLILAHLCVVRPLQHQVRRLRAVVAKHHLEDEDDDDNAGLEEDNRSGGAGDYVILEKDGVRYDAGSSGDRRRAGGLGRHSEQSCEGCGHGCAADAHFCTCCGRPLSFQRPAPPATTVYSHN